MFVAQTEADNLFSRFFILYLFLTVKNSLHRGVQMHILELCKFLFYCSMQSLSTPRYGSGFSRYFQRKNWRNCHK